MERSSVLGGRYSNANLAKQSYLQPSSNSAITLTISHRIGEFTSSATQEQMRLGFGLGEPMRASGTVWTRLHSTQDLGHGTRANSTHVQVWNLIWSRIATKYRPRSHWIGTFAGFAFPQQESVPGWWWLRYTYAKPTWISWIGNLVGDLHDMAARISQRYEFGLLHVKGTID